MCRRCGRPRSAPPTPFAADPGRLRQDGARFLKNDALLAWDLGTNLTAEIFPTVARTAASFRGRPDRPVCCDVWDGFQALLADASEQVMLGIHRWPLMTGMELTGYRDWLTQRRQLAAARHLLLDLDPDAPARLVHRRSPTTARRRDLDASRSARRPSRSAC